MSLDTMPNEILLIIFKSLYPPGFFSNLDWLAAHCQEYEGDNDDEDEEQDEEEGVGEEGNREEKHESEGEEEGDNELDDNGDEEEDEDEDDEEEEDLESSSSSSSNDFRVAREIAAWEHVNEADEAMKSLSQTCRQLRATSQTVLQDRAQLEVEKKQMKMAHLGWNIVREFHGVKLSDAKQEYPDTISHWNETWTALGESLRELQVSARIVQQEESSIVELLWKATEKAELQQIFGSRRPRLWWPRPKGY